MNELRIETWLLLAILAVMLTGAILTLVKMDQRGRRVGMGMIFASFFLLVAFEYFQKDEPSSEVRRIPVTQKMKELMAPTTQNDK